MHDHWPVHSVLPEEDKMNHYAMTKEQARVLITQLATIMEKLGDTAILLNACYGTRTGVQSGRGPRRQRCKGSLGRFEREPAPITSGNAGGSARVREIVEVDTKGNRTLRSLRRSTRPHSQWRGRNPHHDRR
jgi:hypothetical protein